jgi:hypothetical protein
MGTRATGGLPAGARRVDPSMSDEPITPNLDDVARRRGEQLDRIAAWTEQERPPTEPATPDADADADSADVA